MVRVDVDFRQHKGLVLSDFSEGRGLGHMVDPGEDCVYVFLCRDKQVITEKYFKGFLMSVWNRSVTKGYKFTLDGRKLNRRSLREFKRAIKNNGYPETLIVGEKG